ncbi:MAG TPA: Ku protein [Xanthobacteraceae bacterium]|nr:Ku protein [Xanthobacteraceae bacterium]
MPRASWRGFLRLSLVSCPIYLSPSTTRTKPIRLHQVWQPAPADVDEDDLQDRSGGQQGSERSVTRLRADSAAPDGEQSPAATRITLRPHDPGTGEEIEKREVVKGYEYSRGQFLTFTDEELKALDVESSKVVDLEKFVAGSDIDPVYFDSPYYVYPDGPIAVEALRVIGAAMAQAGVVGLGRLTLSRRERMVVVEPRGTGMALFTLRAAGEVRAPQFGSAEGDLDAEMVAIAGTIIRQRTGNFDPSIYRDRYQEALQQLIDAKMNGVTFEPRAVSTPSPVIDLMAALKRSLAQEPSAAEQRTAKRKQTKQTPDRRQPALLLPLTGARKRNQWPSADPAVTGVKKRSSTR